MEHVCDVAILCNESRLPWDAAKVLYQAQRDFNYLEGVWLREATFEDGRICVADQAYSVIIVEPNLVPHHDIGKPIYKVPAQTIAEELGNRIVTNIAMIGGMTGIFDLLSEEAVKKAVIDTVPKRFTDLNVKAFEMGLEAGRNAKPE